MKKLIAILLALVLVLSMTACGSSSGDTYVDDDGNEQEIVEIEFIQWWSVEAGGEYMYDVVADFEALNPGIKVTLIEQPFADTKNVTVSNFATGQSADIIGMNPPWSRELYDMGILAPLDEFINADSSYSLDNYVGVADTIDGDHYTVPVTPLAFFLYYNVDMFEEAGIEPPTTIDEFVDAAIALTDTAANQYGFTAALSSASAANGSILTIYPMLYALGGLTIDDNGDFVCDSEEMAIVLQALADMQSAGALTPGTASNSEMMALEEFKAGTAAMMVQSDAHIISLDTGNPDLNYGIITLPTISEGDEPSLRHHGWDIAISSTSEHKEEAWAFISYLTSEEVQVDLCASLSKIPAYIGADVSYAEEYPNVLLAMEMMEEYEMVEELALMPSSSVCWTALTDAAYAATFGTKTVEQAISDCQAAWDSTLGQ